MIALVVLIVINIGCLSTRQLTKPKGTLLCKNTPSACQSARDSQSNQQGNTTVSISASG
jgi:hypothetical protein